MLQVVEELGRVGNTFCSISEVGLKLKPDLILSRWNAELKVGLCCPVPPTPPGSFTVQQNMSLLYFF